MVKRLSQSSDAGGIITLVPKIQSTFRLSPRTLDTVQRLAIRLDRPRPDVVELAVRHLDLTLKNGGPVYIDEGPEDTEPKAHKTRPRAG